MHPPLSSPTGYYGNNNKVFLNSAKKCGEEEGTEEGRQRKGIERGRGERKGREEEGRQRKGREEGERGRGERKGKGVAHSFKQVKEEKRQNEGNGRETWRGEEGTLHNSARLLVSIAFSSFSGPGVSAPQQ